MACFFPKKWRKSLGADKFKIGEMAEELTIPSSKNEISQCEFQSFEFFKK